MTNIFKRVSIFMLAVCIICISAFTGCKKDDNEDVLVSGEEDVTAQADKLTKEYFENNKTEVIKNSIDYAALFGTENPFKALFTQSDKASVKMGMDLEAMAEIEDLGITFEAVGDAENSKGAVNFELTGLDSNDYDLGVYFDNEVVSLSSKALLGDDTAYGIKLESLSRMAEKFNSSGLAKVLDIPEGAIQEVLDEYGIDDKYISGILEAYSEYEQKISSYTMDKYYDSMLAVYEPYYGNVAYDVLFVDGEQIDALSLTMDVNNDLISAVLKCFTDMYLETYSEQMKLYEAIVPESMKEEVLPSLEDSQEMLIEGINETLEELEQSMDVSGTVEYSIDKKTGLLVRSVSDINLTIDGETCELKLTSEYADDITIKGTATVEEDVVNLDGRIYSQDVNGKLKWACEIDVEDEENPEENSVSLDMGFEIDKNSDEYELYINMTMPDYGDMTVLSVKGTIEYTDSSLAVSIDSMSAEDEEIPVGINMEFNSNAELKTPENVVEIFSLDEDEIYELVNSIAENSKSFVSSIESLFGSGYDDYDYDYDYDDYDYYDSYGY